MSNPQGAQAHTAWLVPDAGASSMSSPHASSPGSPTTTLSQDSHSSRLNFCCFRLSILLSTFYVNRNIHEHIFSTHKPEASCR